MRDRFENDEFPKVSRPESKGRKGTKMRRFIQDVVDTPDSVDCREEYEEFTNHFKKIRTRR